MSQCIILKGYNISEILSLYSIMLQAVCLSGVLLMMEIFDSDRRAFVGIGLEFLWLWVYAWLPLLAMYIVNWRYFQLIISLVSSIWIIYYW